MRLSDLREAFAFVGLDLDSLCETSFQNPADELHYLVNSGIARFSVDGSYSSEILIFYRKNKKPVKEKTILQALQRFEARKCWYSYMAEDAVSFDKDIIRCLQESQEGSYVIGCLTPYSFVLNSFDSLEDGLQTLKDNNFYI